MARVRDYQSEKVWKFAEAGGKKLDIADYSAVFARLLQIRGVNTDTGAAAFLNPKFEALTDPFEIPDMQKAVDRIVAAIEAGEKIAIYGDYDVDGVTATAVLYSFFKSIDVDVQTYIPSRMDEGYGLNNEALKQLSSEGITLLITVDCGVTSIEEVAYAKTVGIDVVVTDHHTLRLDEKGKVTLPEAVAVINPKRMDPDNPLYELAGVAVAFYLARAIQTHFTEKLPLGQEKWLLDLVALGTICDIVPLTGENRILANYGLKVLRKTRRVGIQALSATAEVAVESIDSYKVGFLLGPRLNASGRLEHAKKSLDLLLSEDLEAAQKIAVDLNEINLERQELTERIVTEARDIIAKDPSRKSIYLLANETWPSGVVGIVASRLVDEFRRPMLIAEDLGDTIKGSARSVEGFNVVEALATIGTHFEHFGGHAFAAGFSLKKDKFVLINEELVRIADEKIEVEKLQPEIEIDTSILNTEITQEFISQLSLLEPFGRGNKKPVFAIMGARIADYRLVGNPAVHLKLTIEQGGINLSGIAFGYGEQATFEAEKSYDLAVTLELNEWNNRKTPEFRVIDIREAQK